MVNDILTISPDIETSWEIVDKEKIDNDIIISLRNRNTEEEYIGKLLSLTSNGKYEIVLTKKTFEKLKRPHI